ncbi:MAG: Maf family nucleotide pyrophosphatase [Paramuribaculum sp.]|nr:Maf family nucleotide pyrophosphatase [Paramuribaculum sp.]
MVTVDFPPLAHLSRYKLVLASASPRRRQLLEMLGLSFEVRPISGVDESYPADLPAMDVAGYIARKKCDEGRRFSQADELLVCADTVVIIDGMILGKPRTADDARHMLSMLSGRSHQVVTGLAVGDGAKVICDSVVTTVHFARLTHDEIDYYIDRYSPFDKAGSYGIQEWIGAVGVQGIDGSYYNVMGLPVHRLYRMLLNWKE